MLQIFIVLIALILDQGSKYLVTQSSGNFPIIENVFYIRYARNYGAAFGILTQWQVVIIAVTMVVAVAIAVMLIRYRKAKPLLRISLSLMLGGALGNLIDRVVQGFVVDFFDVRVINFAIFNVADCCVVVGTILFCVYIIFLAEHDRHSISILKKQSDHG